jgi:hypothetical protein
MMPLACLWRQNRVGDALRGDGNKPDDDDGAAGVPVAV